MPTLSPFWAPIKPLGPVVPVFEHLTCELSAISVLGGDVDPDFVLNADTRRPAELLVTGFYR